MSFEEELSRGRFTIPRCTECSKAVWPPADWCPRCFGSVRAGAEEHEGKIVEFSSKDGRHFGIVEIVPGLRIIAEIDGVPEVGRKVRIIECGMSERGHAFRVG